MDTRRTFIKKSSLLMAGTLYSSSLPASIQRAFEIQADPGTTYLDAEHIVFLMQENRSFDHCFGTLKGVRGFNDPRAIDLPNGSPVWLQTNKEGETYGPFQLDIQNTKATWMGSLPHSWKDMVEARNDGKMDNWLEAKKPGNKDYAPMPLTMGYYNREDIPFYYAFADAFTVCDQHFCSSLTGTSANRSFFWAGAIREEPHNPDSVAHVDNGQINYKNVSWKTYPERLQEAGIPWRVYQNELSLPVGFEGEEESWLANFTDNNLEFYKQYNVRFHPAHREYMKKKVVELERELAKDNLTAEEKNKKGDLLKRFKEDLVTFSEENYEKLSSFEKEIHQRAFTTNTEDEYYHKLDFLEYEEFGKQKKVQVPKGDIFQKFRKDVDNNTLPTVSWLVAPCNFSDHPSAPWFGAWYVSETLDILTKNPEIWKKTIFVCTYDENDGYFDHVPPFVPAHSDRKDSGALPKGMKTGEEYVTQAQERIRTGDPNNTLDSPIGLGFRVPMIVASPWSKGGKVNSEVCDITSTLQFLEHFIEHKTGKKVIEENISNWRRAVSGNLTSIFTPANKNKQVEMEMVDRNQYVQRIYSAKDKDVPGDYHKYKDPALIKQALKKGINSITQQEKGVKTACALPYNLNLSAKLTASKKQLKMDFDVQTNELKTKDITVPFQVYSRVPFGKAQETGRNWDISVSEKEDMNYHWKISDFKNNAYNLAAYGPNGFFRLFKGTENDPDITIRVESISVENKPTLKIIFSSKVSKTFKINISDRNYGYKNLKETVKQEDKSVLIDLSKTAGWYDFAITVNGFSNFEQQFAGHIENGKESITDPLMGGVVDKL